MMNTVGSYRSSHPLFTPWLMDIVACGLSQLPLWFACFCFLACWGGGGGLSFLPWCISLTSLLRLLAILLLFLAAIRPSSLHSAVSFFFLTCIFCLPMRIFLRLPPPSPQLFGSSPHCLPLPHLQFCLSLTSPVLFRFALLGLPPFGDFSSSFIYLPGFGGCTGVGRGSSFVFWGPLFPCNHPLLPLLALLSWRLVAACLHFCLLLLLPVSLVSKRSLVFSVCSIIRPSALYSVHSSSSLPRSLMLSVWLGSCEFSSTVSYSLLSHACLYCSSCLPVMCLLPLVWGSLAVYCLLASPSLFRLRFLFGCFFFFFFFALWVSSFRRIPLLLAALFPFLGSASFRDATFLTSAPHTAAASRPLGFILCFACWSLLPFAPSRVLRGTLRLLLPFPILFV